MHWSRSSYQSLLADVLLKYASAARPLEGVVVDLGCGVRPRWWIYGKRASVIGLDLAAGLSASGCPKMISSPHFRMLRADAGHVPLADQSVDAVTFSFLLCTAEAGRPILQEIARILRPGGHMLAVEHMMSRRPGIARIQRFAEQIKRTKYRCRSKSNLFDQLNSVNLMVQEQFVTDHILPLIFVRAEKRENVTNDIVVPADK